VMEPVGHRKVDAGTPGYSSLPRNFGG